MTRSFDDARQWTREGTSLLLGAAAGLSELDWEQPSGLPGWSRKHLGAHVAANADALRNLARWAATGVETPMYSSPEERQAGIERGLKMSGQELLAWLRSSAEALAADWDALTDVQWTHEVVTAQGRTVPATETPWMRAREVCVHAVDFAVGVTFTDLSDDFLIALQEDIVAKRAMATPPVGPLPKVTAWLAGRPHSLVNAPELGPWL
jgi:maleylpyruvate isomerase